MRELLILVVDPNAATRDLLSDVFRTELGAYVTTLTSPSELGPMLYESVYDLVVVEVSRDRIADADAVHTLKTLHAETPFLVLTAWGTDVEAIEEKIGAERVIGKPFSLHEVIAAAADLAGVDPGGRPGLVPD